MELTPDQTQAIEWLESRTESFVWLPVGYGKTIIALQAFMRMREIYGPEWRALVFSTKAILDLTWGQEIEKWNLPLSYRSAVGRNLHACNAQPDVLGVNFENICWYFNLVDAGDAVLPDVLIIDESSKLKAPSAQRTRRLIGQRRRNDPHGWERGYVHRFKRRIAMSATPASEGYGGLWSQEACVSPRRRLGMNLSEFRGRYCHAIWNGVANTYHVTKDGEERIEATLDPITYTARRDFLDLPDPIDRGIVVSWSEDARAQYDRMEDEAALALEGMDPEEPIEAPNIAVLLNKLRQVCSGFLYDDEHTALWTFDAEARLRELELLVDRAGDSALVVFTQFTASQQQVANHFDVDPGLPGSLDDWNAGKIPMLVLHPRSAGHGINLQHGSSQIVWYELPWSREEYDQGIGRLHRRGQTQPVTSTRLMRPASVEDDVWKKLHQKGMKLHQLLDSVGHRRRDLTPSA